MKSKSTSVLIVLAEHDHRVQIRNMIEGNFDTTVISAANPLEGLALLSEIKAPNFVLLSSDPLPIMTSQEFINRKQGNLEIACIPLVLLSSTPIVPLPEGVNEEIKTPVSIDDITALIQKYC